MCESFDDKPVIAALANHNNEGLRYEDTSTGLRLLDWRVRLDFRDLTDAPLVITDAALLKSNAMGEAK